MSAGRSLPAPRRRGRGAATATHLFALALAPVCLAGCLRALMSWGDPGAVPDLVASRTRCAVDAVLAEPGADLGTVDAYAVGFSPIDEGAAPAHLRGEGRAGPAWLWVRPSIDFPAVGAMRDFRPQGFEIDVFDGRHLRRATNNVRLTLHGRVLPRAVGELLQADAVAPDLATARLADEDFVPFGPVRRAIEGLGRHRWTALLAPPGPPPPDGPAEAVAFVGPDGERVAAARMAAALLAPPGDPAADLARGGSLLARVGRDGRSVLVRIPLPVLLNADALQLERDRDFVAFAWARRGRGRFVRPDAVPARLAPVGLPLVDPELVYEWTREVPATSGWREPIQDLLAPLAALLDLLVEANPALRALRDWLFPPAPVPTGPPLRR